MATSKKKPEPTYLTRTEYARHRGCTPSAVTRAIHKGKLKRCLVRRGRRTLLNRDVADREWAQNTAVYIDSPLPPKAKAEAEAAECATETTETTDDNEPRSVSARYQAARAAKVKAEAESAKLKLKKLRGELVDVADVGRLCSDVFSTLRRRLDVLADRMGPDLAPITDPAEIRRRLDDEIRAALTDAANGIANG